MVFGGSTIFGAFAFPLGKKPSFNISHCLKLKLDL